MQGAVPIIIAREIVIRKNVFTAQNSWMIFFLLCFVLAVSAFYELLEWWSAVLIGSAADEFLATQGYVWDTQSDMWYALLGGIISLAIFSRLHDKKLRETS
jgi:putative membrane protein